MDFESEQNIILHIFMDIWYFQNAIDMQLQSGIQKGLIRAVSLLIVERTELTYRKRTSDLIPQKTGLHCVNESGHKFKIVLNSTALTQLGLTDYNNLTCTL